VCPKEFVSFYAVVSFIFSAAGSRLWNSLPCNVTECQILDVIRQKLKHFLFSLSFHGHWLFVFLTWTCGFYLAHAKNLYTVQYITIQYVLHRLLQLWEHEVLVWPIQPCSWQHSTVGKLCVCAEDLINWSSSSEILCHPCTKCTVSWVHKLPQWLHRNWTGLCFVENHQS